MARYWAIIGVWAAKGDSMFCIQFKTCRRVANPIKQWAHFYCDCRRGSVPFLSRYPKFLHRIECQAFAWVEAAGRLFIEGQRSESLETRRARHRGDVRARPTPWRVWLRVRLGRAYARRPRYPVGAPSNTSFTATASSAAGRIERAACVSCRSSGQYGY